MSDPKNTQQKRAVCGTLQTKHSFALINRVVRGKKPRRMQISTDLHKQTHGREKSNKAKRLKCGDMCIMF